MTSASLIHEAGHSELVLWDNPSDGGGRKMRVGFWMGNTCVPMADSCPCMRKIPQYFKVIIPQLK